MKKLMAMILVIVMLLSLAACGEKKKESAPDNILKIGKCEAVYKGSEIVKDSEGADAIVINFDFTNNSDEATSFEWAYYYNVFQEGVGLQYAVVWVSEDSYDTRDESMNTEVQPGTTIPVSMTYKLNSLTAPVKIEVSDLFDKEKDSLTIDLATATWANDEVATTEAVESTEDTEATENTENTEETEDELTFYEGEINADYWLGDWYGTWTILGGTGDYAEMAMATWDCCAFITGNVDGKYHMSIWDEDYNDYNSNCLAETYLELQTEYVYSEHGAMTTTDDEGNYFWTGWLDSDSWYIDPGIFDYNNTIIIYDEIVDDNGDTCQYMITLCKWCTEWDENAGAYPEYYESYFLPLMKELVELPAVFEPNN